MYSTSLFKSVILRYVKRLAVVCLFLSYVATVTAETIYHSKINVSVKETSPTGSGKVYVQDIDSNDPEDYKPTSSDTYSSSSKSHKYKLYASPEPGYEFEGWYYQNTPLTESNISPYTYAPGEWATSEQQNNPTLRNLYASFYTKYKYINHAIVKVIGVTETETPGWVYVDNGNNEYSAISESEWQQESAEYGDEGTVNSPTYTYTYYAKANKTDDGDETNDYTFIGWYATSDAMGAPLSSDLEYEFKSTWTEDQANPLTPGTMYALFKKETYYFYQDASAFVVGEPAGGQVRIIYDKEDNNVTDWATEIVADNAISHNFKATTTNATEDFTITYEAKNNDPNLYAFLGWGVSPVSTPTENMKSSTYTETYTASAGNKTSDNPVQINPLYAIFASYYYHEPAVLVATNSTDAGKVYIDQTGVGTTDGYKDAISAKETLTQVPADEEYSKYKCYYYAQPNTGSEFRGWSTSADGKNIISTNSPYEVTYTLTSTDKNNPNVELPLYAVFASYIDIQQQDRMICYVDNNGNYNINDTKIVIELLKAPKLVAELKSSYSDNANFSLSNANASQVGERVEFDATQGLINLKLSYTGNMADAIGKTAYITLTGMNGSDVIVERTISVVVERAPIVTFVPTDGKGDYTISLTDGSGVFYNMPANTKENLQVQICKENMSNIEMKLTSSIQNGDYLFFGWKKIEGAVSSYISYNPTCVYEFTEPATVQAEFVHKDQASFIIKGQEKKYADLQLALNEAEVLKNNSQQEQVVVFANDFANSTEEERRQGVLPRGNYVIPSGVTLLIPGDGLFTPICGDPDNYYRFGEGDAKLYRKLIVESGTTITVNGKISLSVDAIYNVGADSYHARPGNYGQIELQADSKIILKQGAGLYAFGYLTGDKTSSVVAENGSVVWELFQYTDYRGGSATAAMYRLRNERVFPMNQYYVQNIEVATEFKFGATEYVSSGYTMRGAANAISAVFITSSNVSGSGFFRIGEMSSVIKYYDPDNDRLKITVRGGTSSFGYISMDMGDLGGLSYLIGESKGVVIDTRDYVMPINNNMDIVLEGTTVEILHDVAWLPGATLSVDQHSVLDINGGRVYVYDKDESVNNVSVGNADYYGKGYFASGLKELMPITYTPNDSHLNSATDKRTWNNLGDAKWIVNGKVNVKTNGGLYTTAGKAQIISKSTGQVQFHVTLPPSTTNQAQYRLGNEADLLSQDGCKNFRILVQFPVNSAHLQNADGSYESTGNGTFTYNLAKGKWDKYQLTDTWDIPTIIINKPGEEKEIKVKSFIAGVTTAENIPKLTISLTGDGFTKGEHEFEAGVGLVIPINYKASGTAGEYVGTIIINDGSTTYTQLITAIEDYTPDYYINPSSVETYVGSSATIEPYVVAKTGNVTELVDDTEMQWSHSISGQSANQFELKFGTNDKKLSESKLIFTPLSSGIKTATLHLTAAYTDLSGQVHSTVKEIYLTGVANALDENSLAFEDLSNIYVGQTNSKNLFIGQGSGNDVQIKVLDEFGEEVSLSSFGITNDDEQTIIIPQISGTFTITAEQSPSNTVAGTKISKTITLYPRVKWNWENMYFGNVYDNPISFMDGTSPEYTLEETSDAQNVVNYDPLGKIASISAWEAGEAEATFTFTQGKTKQVFTSNIHRNPRKVRVDVNSQRTFDAVNAGKSGVEFDNLNKTIVFQAPSGQIAQWTMYFEGVPDGLYFTPTQGISNWQIEESPNGTNWMTTHSWAHIANNTPFELSLSPTTRYLRISYGASMGTNKAVLDKFYITALQSIKADMLKLYMPFTTPDPTPYPKRDVVFTYASLTNGLTLETSDQDFELSTTTLPATTDEEPYFIKGVTVTSRAEAEKAGSLYVKDADKTILEIPIRTYQYPQDLPIMLAIDHIERFFFVTTKTYHTSWDATNRSIVFDNAMSDASPLVTFHFSNSPTPGLIYFNHTSCKGIWRIEESQNELDWTRYDVVSNADNLVNQTLNPNSRYVRVTYISSYAEVVDVTNLSIVPTASVMTSETEVTVFKGQSETVKVTANNLSTLSIACSSQNFTINNGIASSLLGSGTKNADLTISYNGTAAMEEAKITFQSGEEVLATIDLIGRLGTLVNGTTGIKTGVNMEGGYTISGPENFIGADYDDVDITAAFADGQPIFDYLFIFGETTTMDASKNISQPNSAAGSNALTPCYIYKKGDSGYDFYAFIENANSGTKVRQEFLQLKDPEPENIKVYITGFAPYASTGYTKNDEGVFFFQGGKGDHIEVYLEECYLYSRYKTHDGHSFIDRSNGESYSEDYVRGSGGVLVFECIDTENRLDNDRFQVTIHTRGHNVLKSHYGCFYSSIVGRAYQVSSPVQVHLASGGDHVGGSYTILNFDDIWPISNGTERTNGFISLQKQVNNAPSIDLGNANTVLNFNGGQVELQNAQIVSTNYKTTMAISHRSGEFAGVRLSYGIGADAAGGTVNFNDGTTTVQPMKVDPSYMNYYLMDEDDPTTPEDESKFTSCLRCPTNTYVYGGSHCMMRACSDPSSKGGAPMNKPASEGGVPLGLYKYPKLDPNAEDANPRTKNFGWIYLPSNEKEPQEGDNGLVKPSHVPDGYGISSVTPNTNGTPKNYDDDYLNFWFDPTFEPLAKPEVDQKLSYWKACMPYIGAEYAGYVKDVGGPTVIERNATAQTELITNFLYCKIDENISNVISSGNYYAPVKNPTPSGGYESLAPTKVGTEEQNYVETYDVTDPEHPKPTGDDYTIAGKVYYITTIPSADVWMTFTAPFDVSKIYVVEAFDEAKLEVYSQDRNEILKYQATHNANFAAFFGVAMALGSDQSFESIYNDYKGWARLQDNGELKRGMSELVHYYRTLDAEGKVSSNWADADYYLYENTDNWTKPANEETFNTHWNFVTKKGGTLLQRHHTYSLFFPYCMGCFDENGERDFWDYWSGKFLIFESVQASEKNPHVIMGSKNMSSMSILPNPDNVEPINGRVSYEYDWPFEVGRATAEYENTITYLNENEPSDESLKLMGNPTFSLLGTRRPNLYKYDENPISETFEANVDWDQDGNPIVKTIGSEPALINPTESFLLGSSVTKGLIPIKVKRSGDAIYGKLNGNGNNPSTGGNIPTVGGGNDLFITETAGGINVAVAAPQQVRVISSTGAVLYSGMVQTAVDVTIPTTGVYVVAGENEVQKILY